MSTNKRSLGDEALLNRVSKLVRRQRCAVLELTPAAAAKDLLELLLHALEVKLELDVVLSLYALKLGNRSFLKHGVAKAGDGGAELERGLGVDLHQRPAVAIKHGGQLDLRIL